MTDITERILQAAVSACLERPARRNPYNRSAFVRHAVLDELEAALSAVGYDFPAIRREIKAAATARKREEAARREEADRIFAAEVSRTLAPAEIAWMDELNAEAVRRGCDPKVWPMDQRLAHRMTCWLADYENGLTPAQALDSSSWTDGNSFKHNPDEDAAFDAELEAIHATIVAEVDAAMAALPPQTSEPDDIPV